MYIYQRHLFRVEAEAAHAVLVLVDDGFAFGRVLAIEQKTFVTFGFFVFANTAGAGLIFSFGHW